MRFISDTIFCFICFHFDINYTKKTLNCCYSYMVICYLSIDLIGNGSHKAVIIKIVINIETHNIFMNEQTNERTSIVNMSGMLKINSLATMVIPSTRWICGKY